MRQCSVLFFCLFLFYHSYGQEGEIPDSLERNALEQLYVATSGDQWDFNDSWLDAAAWPDWYGVYVKDGDVYALDLSFNGLEGELPEALYQLTGLEELNLEFNELEGELSESIGNLVNLEVFYADRNNLSGELPGAIGSLVSLEDLDLSANNFDGAIPEEVGALSNLFSLNLTSNSLSGSIPSTLGNLGQLEILYLSDNLLEGAIPASLGNLSALYDITLDYNLLTGTIPSTFSGLSLKYLSIAYNQLEGNVAQYFADMPLRAFWIFGNHFHGMPDFSKFSTISSLIVAVDENRLDFGDLEPNWTSTGSIFKYPSYSPQDSVETYFNSADFSFSVEVDGQHNVYQWVKNGQTIAGATATELQLDSSTYVETDVYQCQVTNTWITGLTIWSKSKSIRPGTYYAIADGNWSDLIWSRESGGELAATSPGEGSEVYIVSKNVTLNQDLVTGSVHVIVDGGEANLVVDGAEMVIVGTLDLTKETEGYPGNVQVLNGGRIIPKAP